MATDKSGALQKGYIQVGLNGGLNRKRDAHQLQNGELLTADNVVYSAVDGQVTKRFGYKQVTPQGAPFQGGPFTAIGCRDDKEPIVLGQNTLNRYNVAQNLSTALPMQTQGRLSVSQVASSSGQTAKVWPPVHAHVAADDAGKYACLVWEEPNVTGSIMYYGIQDQANGNWIIPPQRIPPMVTTDGNKTYFASAQPQVQYANGLFYISMLWVSVASNTYYVNVVCNTINTANLASGFFPTATLSDCAFVYNITQTTRSDVLAANTSWSYDLKIANGQFILGLFTPLRGGGVGVVTGYVSARAFTVIYNDTLGLPPVAGASSTGQYNVLRVACAANGPSARPFALSTGICAWTLDNRGNSSQYKMQDTGSALYYPTSPVDITYVGNSLYFTSYGFDSLGIGCMYLWATTSSMQSVSQIKCIPVVGSYLIEMLSRIFVLPSGRVCFWVGGGSNTSDDSYNSAFLMEADVSNPSAPMRAIARAVYQSNYENNYGDKTTPCEVFRVANTSQYVTLLTQTTELGAPPNSETWRAYGTLNRVAFNVNPMRQMQVVSLPPGGNLIAGAYPLYYDGNEIVESGFSAAPDYTQNNPSIAGFQDSDGQPTASKNGLMGAAQYTYICCFVRRDAYGNTIRSAPSSPIQVNQPYSNGSVAFRPLYYAGGGNVRVEYYRNTPTLAGQGTYYFVGSAPVLSPTYSVYNDFVDTLSDGGIVSSRSYNLSETPCDPPPAIYHIALSDTRAYCIPADSRNQVWASKLFTPGRSVEWNSSQYLTEGSNAGLFTGLAVLDANVIVFKADSICYFYGQGPDNSGSNGGFSALQRLATDVGCIDAASIKVTPDGVVFRSRRGIELLTRSLQIVYIGNNVEPIVQSMGAFSSVVLMPNYTELRFVPATPGQPVLCYDYGQKRWSTFGMGAIGLSTWASVQAASMQGDYWWISADGSSVNIETPNAYLDAGLPIDMTLETAEVPMGTAGPQGWGRLFRMALLGDFYTDHKLVVSFQYDHEPYYTDSVLFDTKYGLISGDQVYQFRLSRVPRQRMQTVRFRFQDSAISGQSCAISNLVLEVADKAGLARLSAAKTL